MHGEELRQARMLKSMKYRKQWATLYMEQKGKCAHCGSEIDMETGWDDHHILPRVEGGTDALGNRVLLHPSCHKQVHSLKLKVVKLVSE
jgi:RNA-directed DNA polymerase